MTSTKSKERSALARMVMHVFRRWRLSNEEQFSMLGLTPSNQAVLNRYRRGKPLGSNRDLLDRAGHIIAIHKSLRLIFPQNRDAAYSWMTRRNLAFKGITPVELVKNYGFTGLLMVRAYLDRQCGS